MSILTKYWDKLGGLVGLGGGQGDYYQAPKLESEAKNRLDEALRMGDNAEVQKVISGLGAGTMSLADVLAGATKSGQQDSALQAIVSSPVAGSSLASQQVIEDPLLAGMYGADSSMSRATAEEQELASRGFSLKPEDYEAYGQASGNIARSFGKQEAGLAQALAGRGLAAGNSGAAQSSFSGMYGNKLEQLGQMQRQIADDRMSKNLERLNSTRNYQMSLGQLGQQAQGQKFDQNQTANNQQQSMYGMDIDKYRAEQGAAQASQASKEANRLASLSDAVGGGIMKGVEGGISSGISQGASSIMPGPSAPTTTKRNYVETDGYQKKAY